MSEDRYILNVHYFDGKEFQVKELVVNPTQEEIYESQAKFLNEEYERGNIRFAILDFSKGIDKVKKRKMIKRKIGICKQCKENCDKYGVEPKEKEIYAKGLCFYHYQIDCAEKSRRKAFEKYIFPASKLKSGKKKPVKKFKKPTGEASLFKQIWEEREHICINCKVYLGDEPIVHYFSHRKGKGANPELRLDKDNIDLLCRDCHYARDFQGKDKFNKRTK